MRYLFLLWGDEAAELALSESERRAIVAAHGDFMRGLVAAGRSVTGEPLGPARDGDHRRPAPTVADRRTVPRDQGAARRVLSHRVRRSRGRDRGRPGDPGEPGLGGRDPRDPGVSSRERKRIDRPIRARLRWTPRPGSEVDLPGDLLLPLFIVTLIANAFLVAAAIRSLRHDSSRSRARWIRADPFAADDDARDARCSGRSGPRTGAR